MSALPGLVLKTSLLPVGQIKSRTTQQGVSRTQSHHRQQTGQLIINRVG
jgi:hypothetical protein